MKLLVFVAGLFAASALSSSTTAATTATTATATTTTATATTTTATIASSVSATTTTATSATPLASLIAAIPECAIQCFSDAATDVGCQLSDLSCFCGSANISSPALLGQISACLFLSSCTEDEAVELKSLSPKLCGAVSTAASTALAVASQEIVSELAVASSSSAAAASAASAAAASATSTKSSTQASASGNGAPPAAPHATMALLGIGGVAVMAAYAL